MRRIAIRVGVILTLVMPSMAYAKVDPSCPASGSLQRAPSATSVIEGRVTDALGNPLANRKVELYVTNRNVPTADSAITNAIGFYRICTGENSGSYYDTFDVHVREPDGATAPLFASVNQPYTTYANPLGNADFTDASGLPMLYMTNLTISPNAISPLSGSVPVVFSLRSKAPSSATFKIVLGYPTPHEVSMTYDAASSTSPSAGGWNVWKASQTIAQGAAERMYWATVRGYLNGIEATQREAQPYTIDTTPPAFGPKDAALCGPGITANGMSPVSPPGTTNPTPLVVHDACDPWRMDPATADPTRSGLDPTTLRGWLCTSPTSLASCTEIDPVLSTRSIIWSAPAPLNGDYWIRWRLADKAGNIADSGANLLRVGSASKGQTPFFTALSPGNLGSGSSGGLIIGSSMTTPSSLPVIGFRLLDADGQEDLAVGAVKVRVYYGDTGDAHTTLVYDYDPTMPENGYDPLTKRGGADFDLSSGLFKATGYALQAKPPGRYVVSASATDRAGNNATVSWHFILIAAI